MFKHCEVEDAEWRPGEACGPKGCTCSCVQCNRAFGFIRVPDQRLEELDAAFAKLKRRAKRLGVPEPGFDVVGEEVTERKVDGKLEVTHWVHVVPWEAEVKVPGDWLLVGAVDHLPDGESGWENAVVEVPNHEGLGLAPRVWRKAAPDCDHCKQKRVRHRTYVLWSVNQGRVQVGSTCIRDFLGHGAPENIVARFEWLRDLSALLESDWEPGGGGGGWSPWMKLAEYLPWVAQAIRKHGWVSRGRARDSYDEVASADVAWGLINESETKGEPRPVLEDEDYQEAAGAVAWAAALDDNVVDESTYLGTLRSLARLEAFHRQKHAGFAASMVSAWQREQQRLHEAERRKRVTATSRHLGDVKERRGFGPVEVVGLKLIEGNYGLTTIVSFETDDGCRLKWFASGEKDLSLGSRWVLTGTVKKHDEYRGLKETVVTRCKLEAVA